MDWTLFDMPVNHAKQRRPERRSVATSRDPLAIVGQIERHGRESSRPRRRQTRPAQGVAARAGKHGQGGAVSIAGHAATAPNKPNRRTRLCNIAGLVIAG